MVGACTAVNTQLPATIVLIGIVPESLDTSLDLSPTLQARVDDVVMMLCDELQTAGCILTQKQVCC